MGIKSTINWSGTVVNGVLLGEPAIDEDTGEYHWDGGVPQGVLDAVGMLELPENEEGVKIKVKFEEVAEVKFKEPKKDEDGNDIAEPHLKDDVLTVDDTIYYASKDTSNLPPHSDWSVVKDKEDKVKVEEVKAK